MKNLIVLIIVLGFLPLCWANNDDMVTENINKVKSCLKNEDLGRAKEILAGDYDKYVKVFYSKKFNRDSMIGFYNLEYISLYSGLIAFIEDDYKKANEYMRAAIGLINTAWGESWYSTFNSFIKDNEQIFSRKNNSMKAKLYHMVSIVYEGVGKKDNEVKYLKKAYGLNPKNYEITVKLARYYSSAGNLETSKEYFLKALRLNPNDSKALSDTSIIMNITGENKKALDMIEKAVKIDPNGLEVRINHALLLYLNNRSDEAEKLNAETISKFPDNRDHLERVSLYFLLDKKKYKKAYEIVKKFAGSELQRNDIFTALAAITFAYNNEEIRAKLIVKRMAAEYPDCKKDKFLKSNWLFRRDIYKKFTELISQ